MTKVVVFYKHTARVYWNPENLAHFKKNPAAMIDPDTSKVDLVEQHYWKRGPKNTVIEMTQEEKSDRLKEIQQGVEASMEVIPRALKSTQKSIILTYLIVAFGSIMVGYLLGRFIG